jgi:hypothetical protein
MNKWKAIPVAKAVRVVMQFQGAVALVVIMAVATPELLNLGSDSHAAHQKTQGKAQPINRTVLFDTVVESDIGLPPSA